MFVSRLAVDIFSVCSPYVRGSFLRMFAVCSSYVRRMFAVCSPYVRRMLADDSPYIRRIFAIPYLQLCRTFTHAAEDYQAPHMETPPLRQK